MAEPASVAASIKRSSSVQFEQYVTESRQRLLRFAVVLCGDPVLAGDLVTDVRADAPTTAAAWDGYLERMAPGSKAAGAQGKFIVQVLHQDLVAPKAAAALLRYTASCPGLRTLAVRPVDGQQLVGVTCTSMTNGSYGLAFDAASHAFVGCVPVTGSRQDGPAEIVRATGIVAAIGQTP